MQYLKRKNLRRAMNSGLTEIVEEIQTKFRRPPQVKSSKAQIHAKFHNIPTIRSEYQKLLDEVKNMFKVIHDRGSMTPRTDLSLLLDSP